MVSAANGQILSSGENSAGSNVGTGAGSGSNGGSRTVNAGNGQTQNPTGNGAKPGLSL